MVRCFFASCSEITIDLPGIKRSRAAWGEYPIGAIRNFLILRGMKILGGKKYLTLGEFIERVYEVCDKRKAGGIVRIALKAHLIKVIH